MGNGLCEIVYLGGLFIGLGFAILYVLPAGIFAAGAESGREAVVRLPSRAPVTVSMIVAVFGGATILLKRFSTLAPAVHAPIAVAAISWMLFRMLGVGSKAVR